ncbi:MAG: hypothetical protein WCG28_01805 [bacterium]
MNPKTFNELKTKIQNAIQQKLAQLPNNHGEAGFTLIDGFLNFPIQDKMDGSLTIGGPTVPMVAIMGNTSGRVTFFPLKALIPDFDK